MIGHPRSTHATLIVFLLVMAADCDVLDEINWYRLTEFLLEFELVPQGGAI